MLREQPPAELLEPVGAAGHQDEIDLLGREPDGEFFADASAGAGDEGGTTGESHESNVATIAGNRCVRAPARRRPAPR
jgi:hypothetical protein